MVTLRALWKTQSGVSALPCRGGRGDGDRVCATQNADRSHLYEHLRRVAFCRVNGEMNDAIAALDFRL